MKSKIGTHAPSRPARLARTGDAATVPSSPVPVPVPAATPPARPISRLGRALKAINPLARLPMHPESQGWAGPFGVPGRTYNNITGPMLPGHAVPDPAPRGQPPTATRAAAMDARLTHAAGMLSRAGGPGPRALAQESSAAGGSSLLLDDFRRSGLDDASARDAAAFAGAALSAAVGDIGGRDVITWQGLCSGAGREGMTNEARRSIDTALRVFASNGPAFDALWHMMSSRGHPVAANPDHKPAWRQALQAVDKLVELGAVDRETDLDWQAVARQADGQRATLLRTRLGGSEPKEALAWMTLLHAEHRLRGAAGPAPDVLRAASMAWRNGYTTSGEGTDFHRAVHRMHKFATWVNRAVQPQAFGSFAQRTLGRQLSPMLAMRHGLLGADLGDIATETRRLVRHTQDALAALRQAVEGAAGSDVDNASKALLRSKAAVLDHWIGLGDDLHDGAELDAAQRSQLRAELQRDPSAAPASPEAQAGVLGARFSLGLLERWAHSPDIAAHGADGLKRHLDAVRRTAEPSLAFQVVDADRVALRELARRALDTEGMEWQHGGTVGLEPVANLGFVTGGLAFSGAGATLRVHRGRAATVRIGTSTVGSDLFFGTGTRRTAGVSGFAYAGGSPDAMVRAGAAVRLTYRRESAEQRGVSLRVSKTVPDHKAQCAAVIDFLFGAAEEAASRPIDPPALWQRFADRFFDSDVSVNLVEADSLSHRVVGAVSLGAGLAVSRQSVGLNLRAGYEGATLRARRLESAGHATSATAIDRQTSGATTQATSGWNPIPAVALSGGRQVDAVGIVPLPVLACRADFGMGSSSAGQVRLTSENDRVVAALSLQQREFRSQDEFIGQVQARRAQWEAALGGAGAFEQAMAEIRSLSLLPHKAAGNRWFTERLQLTPDAASRLSLLRAQRSFGCFDAGVDAAGQSQEIDSAIEAELNDGNNWQPEKLAVFEVAKAEDTVGPDFVVVANTTLQATSVTRYLYQAKAQQPDPAVTADTIADAPSAADVAPVPALAPPARAGNPRRAPDSGYVGSLLRALLRALPAAEGSDPNRDAYTVLSAMRDARMSTLDAIQVLASIKSRLPGATQAIDDARVALEATLECSEAGRAALARLRAP